MNKSIRCKVQGARSISYKVSTYLSHVGVSKTIILQILKHVNDLTNDHVVSASTSEINETHICWLWVHLCGWINIVISMDASTMGSMMH